MTSRIALQEKKNPAVWAAGEEDKKFTFRPFLISDNPNTGQRWRGNPPKNIPAMSSELHEYISNMPEARNVRY